MECHISRMPLSPCLSTHTSCHLPLSSPACSFAMHCSVASSAPDQLCLQREVTLTLQLSLSVRVTLLVLHGGQGGYQPDRQPLAAEKYPSSFLTELHFKTIFCGSICGCTPAMGCTWRSENKQSRFPFCHVGSLSDQAARTLPTGHQH